MAEQPDGPDRMPGHEHTTEVERARADRRWDISTWRDWIILTVMCLLFIAFCLSLYLFEPGIR